MPAFFPGSAVIPAIIVIFRFAREPSYRVFYGRFQIRSVERASLKIFLISNIIITHMFYIYKPVVRASFKIEVFAD